MPIITPGTGSRCQAITDIIESVALEQTALSHILNAEGEKLQAVIAVADVSPAQLLDANTSVSKLTNAVSRLELILQSKLELFSDCICTECNTTSTTTTTTSTTSTTTSTTATTTSTTTTTTSTTSTTTTTTEDDDLV